MSYNRAIQKVERVLQESIEEGYGLRNAKESIPTKEQDTVLDYWAIHRTWKLSTFEGIHDRHDMTADDARRHLEKILTEHREQALNAVLDRIEEHYDEDLNQTYFLDPVSGYVQWTEFDDVEPETLKERLAAEVVERGLQDE